MDQGEWIDDFLTSNHWWEICGVPLSSEDMIRAIAAGDAEVEEHEDEMGPGIFFRWLRPLEERKRAYELT